GGVLEAADLVVLGEQIADRVVDEVDQAVAAAGTGAGHVADDYIDGGAAGLFTHPVHHVLGQFNAVHAHAGPGERQGDPACAHGELERVASLGLPAEEGDGFIFVSAQAGVVSLRNLVSEACSGVEAFHVDVPFVRQRRCRRVCHRWCAFAPSIVRLRQGGPDREGYVAAAAGVTYLVPRPARPAHGPGVPGCRAACVLNSLAAGILVVVAMGTLSRVFAGREHELEVLAGAFTAAARGTPAFVLVGAEAGGGKSRLASEFAASVSGRALLLTGGCVELSGPGLPYAPFAAA